MANTSLFSSTVGPLLRRTDVINEAGGRAYRLSPKQALAQYAATGCLHATFYASAETQLTTLLELCDSVPTQFIGKTAVYCRRHGFMRDVPALLLAVLSRRDLAVFRAVFPRIIDTGRMVRSFVQIMRSGAVGRKSLGSAPKAMVRQWLAERDEEYLFRASVGREPSLADIVKMVHPKPQSVERRAFYGYLLGRDHTSELLPKTVRAFEAFKAGRSSAVPDVPFQMLTALELDRHAWQCIARRAGWHMTRMNLNTFMRHGVFSEDARGQAMTELVANKLRKRSLIRRARVFPYQLLMAYKATDSRLPLELREALQDAMEVALENVPALTGTMYVCPDVSGSMQSPVTGYRRGATTSARCIDVAALLAAALLRKNKATEVLPFERHVVSVALNGRDTVMTNAERLAAVGGGGTNCSAPLALLNKRQARGNLVVYVSDNESWVDSHGARGTATMIEWNRYKRRNPAARLICIDIQPYGTIQTQEREDIINVGGFSDRVFDVIERFARGRMTATSWVDDIEAVAIDGQLGNDDTDDERNDDGCDERKE